MFYSLLISATLLSAGMPENAVESVNDSIQPVTVIADRGILISRTDTVKLSESISLSDALRTVPGLYLGDYGSLAGLKSVSLRGLGSANTAIYMDGVRVGNVQSGQNDLSMFGAENLASAVVDYAQNTVSFNTIRPVFDGSSVKGRFSFGAGSFSTYKPYARLDFRLSDKMALSAHASYLTSKGDFAYGDGLTRENNDLKQLRAGLDLFGDIEGGDFHVKAYYNDAERGTPGSISWPSEDRQSDRNAFVQGVVKKRFSPLYSLNFSGKVSYDDICYSSQWGDSNYGQTEFQINSTHAFHVKRWLTLGLVADFSADILESSNYNASRVNALAGASAAIRAGRFSADLALEYNHVSDRAARSWNAVSPSADLRLNLFKGLDLVAFGRRAYRIPTFNELYYVGYGNPDLNEEDAWLTDAGLDFGRTFGNVTLKARADWYYNMLSNKITSAPSPEDPNIWAPYNIGKVHAKGVDLLAGFDLKAGEWTLGLNAAYAFQDAVDKTADSYTYGQQIPYVSRHTMSVSADIAVIGFRLSPMWQLHKGRKDSASELPDWNSLDVVLSKTFSFRRGQALDLRITGRNLLDCRYEVVSGYPMEGRSFLAGIGLNF